MTQATTMAPRKVKLVVCGLDRAGKSTIIKYIQEGQHVQTMRTLGYTIEDLKLKRMSIEVHDLGGQQQFRADWKMHFPASTAIIWVVDSSAPDRFQEAKSEFDQIKNLIPGNSLFLLLANKQDLEEAKPGEEIQQFLQVDELGITVKSFETSAITAEGLKEAFSWLYENIEGQPFQEISYVPPAIHLQDGTFSCIYLQAEECPFMDNVPAACPKCPHFSCENCLNQVPECLTFFEERTT